MTDLTPEDARARAERLQARVLNGTATRADVDWLVETIETLEAALDAERARANTYRDALMALMMAEPEDHAAVQDRCAWGDPEPHACVWCIGRKARAALDTEQT